jgi:hypothetical protein
VNSGSPKPKGASRPTTSGHADANSAATNINAANLRFDMLDVAQRIWVSAAACRHMLKPLLDHVTSEQGAEAPGQQTARRPLLTRVGQRPLPCSSPFRQLKIAIVWASAVVAAIVGPVNGFGYVTVFSKVAKRAYYFVGG